MAACSVALVLTACSDSEDNNGAAGAYGYGGAAGSAAGNAGAAGTTPDGGENDAAAGSAGSADDGGQAGSSGTAGTAGGAGSTSDAGADGAAAATWTQVYTTIISQKCTPCHTTANGGGITIGKLDMTSQATAYMNLVNAPAAGDACSGQGTRVTPGDAASSLLYKKIEPGQPAPCGAKMPLGGAELSQDEAATIESWIQAGAAED